MKGVLKIKRNGKFEEFSIEAESNTPVTKLLDNINDDEDNPVAWDCNCGQNICGACADAASKSVPIIPEPTNSTGHVP